MPGGEVGGEEESGESDGDRKPAPRPVDRLAGGAGEQPEEGDGERQPPEAGGNRAGVGETDQPGPEGERDIAGKERRIGKPVAAGVGRRQRTCRK